MGKKWIDYNEYLNSPAWSRVKDRVWKRSKGKCEVSGCTEWGKDCHHRTYERLGHERITNDPATSDVILVCRGCHREAHGKSRQLSVAEMEEKLNEWIWGK